MSSTQKSVCLLSITKHPIYMNLYLIIFTAGTYRAEQVYDKHKDLFVELEKHFTLHLVNYTEADSIPSNEYKWYSSPVEVWKMP